MTTTDQTLLYRSSKGKGVAYHLPSIITAGVANCDARLELDLLTVTPADLAGDARCRHSACRPKAGHR